MIRTGDTLGERELNGDAEFLHSLKGKIYATVVSARRVAAFSRRCCGNEVLA